MTANTNDARDEDSPSQTTDPEPTSHTGSSWKVLGELDDAGAMGVLGHNTATTGTGSGVEGVTDSSDRGSAGVRANAPNGGTALAANASGSVAIDARTTEYTAITARTDGADFNALAGFNNATTGWSWGVRGDTDSTNSNANGVKGYANAVDGAGNGVSGTTSGDGDGATGVHGEATASTGTTYGVYGTSASSGGFGVFSQGDSKTDGDHEVTGSVSIGGYGSAAYLSSSTTITNDTMTRIPFDATSANDRGEFSTTSHEFTAARAGTYRVDVNVNWSQWFSQGDFYSLHVEQNGSEVAYAARNSPGDTVPASISVSKTIHGVSGGDTISAAIHQKSGGDMNLMVSDSGCYIDIAQVA